MLEMKIQTTKGANECFYFYQHQMFWQYGSVSVINSSPVRKTPCMLCGGVYTAKHLGAS